MFFESFGGAYGMSMQKVQMACCIKEKQMA